MMETKKYLRCAQESDVELLFRWANDKEVRANSFHTEEVSYPEHQKWFKEMMGRDNIRQYIYMSGEEPVGQVRISIIGEDARISYSIASKYRYKGYGKEMILALKEKVKEECWQVKCLTAQVKPGNEASQKIFLECGYLENYREFKLALN